MSKVYDLHLKEYILPNLKKDEEGKYIIIDPSNDFKRFMRLHSWYNHFRNRVVRIYPFLFMGKEPRNEFDRENLDNENLHWRFWVEGNNYDYEEIEIILPDFVNPNHYFHLNQLFGNYDTQSESLHKFNVKCMEKECQMVWNDIMKLDNSSI